ncbi:hypothetical protein M422DRAFT_247161 [Sphaerobolus stellatus SS14]|nr:hypothetical protein M422DRAFT_247161 [Sphaerobolus stellatus SS14]
MSMPTCFIDGCPYPEEHSQYCSGILHHLHHHHDLNLHPFSTSHPLCPSYMILLCNLYHPIQKEDEYITPTTASETSQKKGKDMTVEEHFDLKYDVVNKTNTEILAKQIRNWHSPYYAHFKLPPSIITVPNKKTGHMKMDSLIAFANASTYSPGCMHYLLGLWVACCHHPYNIINDPKLQAIFQMLYSHTAVPSSMTVSQDVREFFAFTCLEVTAGLQAMPGKLHLGINGWLSPNTFPGLESPFTSLKMPSYGIEKKILGIISDNAENNQTMIREVTCLLPDYYGSQMYVHCFAHMLDLIATLSPFTCKIAKPEDDGTLSNEASARIDDTEHDITLDLQDLNESLDEEDEQADNKVHLDRESHDDDIFDAVALEDISND